MENPIKMHPFGGYHYHYFWETPTDPNLLGHPNGRWAPDRNLSYRSKAEAWVAKMNAEASAKVVRGDSRFRVFCLEFGAAKHVGGGSHGFCFFFEGLGFLKDIYWKEGNDVFSCVFFDLFINIKI